MEKSESNRKRRIQWKPEAEEVLLDIWAQKHDQDDGRRSAHKLEEMALMLEDLGYPFDIYEIKAKLHNLTTRYRQERKKSSIIGSRSTWSYFDRVHSILGKYETDDWENENSFCKSETSNEFAFVQSDSFIENKLSAKDVLTNSPIKQNFNSQTSKRKYSDDEFTTNSKNYEFDDAPSSSIICINKLAKTVDNAVDFIIKSENVTSRNESFLKVLDSYLLQLPEKIQDNLKIDLLNIVHNKIKAAEEIMEDS